MRKPGEPSNSPRWSRAATALDEKRLQSGIYLETTVNEQMGLLPGEARAVKHAMTSALTVASPQTSMQEATTMMKELGVPVIVVYDGHRLVGVLSDRDVALNPPIPGTAEHMTIESVMRADASTCREDDRLADAGSLMRASNLEWLPVLDRGAHLVGVLSCYAVP